MIAEFETLQQLLREENAEPGGEASGEPGPARKAPLARELRSESSESQPCSASFCQGVATASDAWFGGRLDPWDHGHLHREAQESRRPEESGAPACLVSPQILETLLPSTPDPSPHSPPLCPESAGYSGPVTRTMARQLSALAHTLGVPRGPDCTPPQASREATEKKRRRPSPSEPDSPPAPKAPGSPVPSAGQRWHLAPQALPTLQQQSWRVRRVVRGCWHWCSGLTRRKHRLFSSGLSAAGASHGHGHLGLNAAHVPLPSCSRPHLSGTRGLDSRVAPDPT